MHDRPKPPPRHNTIGRPASLWVPFGLAAAPMVSLGLARFGYALLLPSMRANLDWSYAQAGAMNTVNAAGYLAGAAVTGIIAAQIGNRITFLVGLFGTAAALMLSAAVSQFKLLLLLRAAAGFCGALAFVIGAMLAAEAGTNSGRERQSLFIAIYFGGGGLGVALSSLIIPIVLAGGPDGWRWGWFGFSIVSILAGLLAIPALNIDETGRIANADADADAEEKPSKPVSLVPIFAAYGLFGAGYIAYMTFIVAHLRSRGFDSGGISVFWIMLGLTSAISSFFWARIIAHLRGGWPMLVVLLMNAAGALAPLLAHQTYLVFVSAALFGASLMAAPSAMTAFVRYSRPRREWTKTIGNMTVLFGLGQCAGPLLAGALSDGEGGIGLGLKLSVSLLLLAAFAAAFQREHPDQAPHIRGLED